MSTLQQKIDVFRGLGIDEKYKIVFSMFEKLKATNNNFLYVYENLPLLKTNDLLLNELYEGIIRLADKKLLSSKNTNINKINKIADYIRKIQESEQQDRDNDNVDGFLDDALRNL